ncbi:MAG: preprotein translocase subunit SecG [Ezakiella sp.]|nr:preprotein translocase subunit SecG [Ezakiella sp.]MDD7471983.1 preprotein translocase subunit SecG [Bacillota bacterium]MDY3923947.1 preprotein translocase subunit SecG [Ezakiella sp.]
MTTVLYIIVFLSALALIALMMIQEGADQNSVLMGVPPEVLWGRNKSASRDATLKRMTVISAVVFFVSTLILAAIS